MALSDHPSQLVSAGRASTGTEHSVGVGAGVGAVAAAGPGMPPGGAR